MPAGHALLGLLALEDDARHGYDLARHFAEGQPLAEVIRLEVGMLYHHLKKLARAGWVVPVSDVTDSRPTRQVYALTDAGQTELWRWLGHPVAHTREIRLEFLVKLYFARRLEPPVAERLVADQLAHLQRREHSLASQVARLAPESDPNPLDDRSFARLVLDLRLAQTRAAIAWLERVSGTAGRSMA